MKSHQKKTLLSIIARTIGIPYTSRQLYQTWTWTEPNTAVITLNHSIEERRRFLDMKLFIMAGPLLSRTFSIYSGLARYTASFSDCLFQKRQDLALHNLVKWLARTKMRTVNTDTLAQIAKVRSFRNSSIFAVF